MYFCHENSAGIWIWEDLGSVLTESRRATTRQKISLNCQVNDKNMSFCHKSGLGSKKSKRQTTPTSDNLLPTPHNRNQTTRKRLQPSTVDTLQSTVRTRQPTPDNQKQTNKQQ